MTKTRKSRRGSRRMRRMRGRGLFNTMKAKASNMKAKTMNFAGKTQSYLTPSNATKNKLRQATFAITPSEQKQSWMKNKYGKAKNVTRSVASGVGSVAKGVGSAAFSGVKGAAGLARNIATSPAFLAYELSKGF